MDENRKLNKTELTLAANHYYSIVHDFAIWQKGQIDDRGAYYRFLESAKQLAMMKLPNPFLKQLKELEAEEKARGPQLPDEYMHVTGVADPEKRKNK